MIYLDTSVALAHLLGEDRAPSAALWREVLVSSRLLEYEIWTRLHAYGLAESHGENARLLVGRVGLIKLDTQVLQRALEPFPCRVRTLDAFHLASMHYLLAQGHRVELGSYDQRTLDAAGCFGWSIYDCG